MSEVSLKTTGKIARFHLYKRIAKALNEKDVENVYRELFSIAFPDGVTTSPHGTDGVLKSAAHDLVALMEFKYDHDFQDRQIVMSVLVQCLYYLRKFLDAGDTLPAVIFVGDINECFCVGAASLEKYLAADWIDWSIAPSDAPNRNARLLTEMYADQEISPWVFKLPSCHFSQVIDKMLDLNKGIVRHVVITEKNIGRIFDDFCDRVVRDKRGAGKSDSGKKANELVGVFLGILTNRDEFYLHPTKKNTLITPTVGPVKVNQKAFAAFFNHFQREYTPADKERLIGVCDRLIEDTKRRRDGAFFTPTIWVDEAHRMITEQLGDNWRDEYVVWDCCWGTGNLTRDYRFKELYCSTLIADELKLGEKYNSEAVKFQYDFLGEARLDGLPPEAEGLKQAFADGRKVLFLINSPYGTATNAGTKDGDHKAGVAKTVVNEAMKKVKIGASSQQLYAQFLWKMATLGGTVATFSPPLVLTGPSFKAFRKFWLEKYHMMNGMLFQASEFADVTGQWGIMFSVWQQGQQHWREWSIPLKQHAEGTTDHIAEGMVNQIAPLGQKTLYNTDGRLPASEWVRQEVEGLKTFDAPQIASALVVKQSGRGRSVEGHIGYLTTVANCVYKNGTDVFFVSECSSMANGLSVIPANFRKCCALFTARRTIGRTWENWQDEYRAPDDIYPDYEQWNDDAIVYSLFNTKSNQSSLRNVEYKGKTWQIKNSWFWLPRERMIQLANEHGNDAVYQDARTDSDRFVHKALRDLTCSADARAVLNKATGILGETFAFRGMADDEHPEWQVNTWDAGWYQVKLLAKRYTPELLEEFRKLYKKFEGRMREGVYTFGFLRK